MDGTCSKWPMGRSCDISVIGYSSKIFRDDEKAKELEQGKHLIPWMGDTCTTIDRFDVRAYLSDVTQFSCVQEHKVMCVEDKEIEELCENERYKALLDIERNEEIYEEEDQKRLKHSLNRTKIYSQVFYSYEDPNSLDGSKLELIDEPFKPDPKFEIPPDIVLPTSSNLNKIIERTAACVFKHGKQMEILIKARQSKNSKFNFMNFNSDLNPYYQFILTKMKTGNLKENRKPTGNASFSQVNSKSTFFDGMDLAPGVGLRTSENCPYNMLVDKIQEIHKVKDFSKIEQ